MTQRARRFLVGTVIAVAAASCASDSSAIDAAVPVDGPVRDAAVAVPDAMPDAPNLVATGTLSAEIDATAWNATTAAASFSNGTLAIGGDDGNGRSISIGVDTTVPGTYTVDGDGVLFLLTEGTNVWQALTPNGSGSVTIVSLTSMRTTGSFMFVAAHVGGGSEDRIITNGTFDLSFGP